jgi:hypothetical protein
MSKFKIIICIILVLTCTFSGYLLYNNGINSQLKNTISTACKPNITIPKYKDSNIYQKIQGDLKYLDGFTKDEIRYGETEIYPNLKNSDDYIFSYLEAMRCQDSSLVKLLYGIDFPTLDYNNFSSSLEKEKNKFFGQEYTLSKCKKDKCSFVVETKNGQYFFAGGMDHSGNYSNIFKPDSTYDCKNRLLYIGDTCNDWK